MKEGYVGIVQDGMLVFIRKNLLGWGVELDNIGGLLLKSGKIGKSAKNQN